jgi:hypothetical protein
MGDAGQGFSEAPDFIATGLAVMAALPTDTMPVNPAPEIQLSTQSGH